MVLAGPKQVEFHSAAYEAQMPLSKVHICHLGCIQSRCSQQCPCKVADTPPVVDKFS